MLLSETRFFVFIKVFIWAFTLTNCSVHASNTSKRAVIQILISELLQYNGPLLRLRLHCDFSDWSRLRLYCDWHVSDKGAIFLVNASASFAFNTSGYSETPHRELRRQGRVKVACKRRSSVNSGAWLRRFDDVTGVAKSCVAKGINRKKAKEKKFIFEHKYALPPNI